MGDLNIVMYHYVRDLKNSRYPDIKGMDYKLFKEQIAFFAQHFHVICMEDLINYYIYNQGRVPDNALILTFDDGYIDNFTYALPILDEYHMQGSFFVPGKVFTEHKLLDVNKIHLILANAPVDYLCGELFERLDAHRGEEWEYPTNQELFSKYAVPNCFDCKEVIFFKRILQVALPEELRNIICDELYHKIVGVPEEVMAGELYMNYEQMKLMRRAGMFFGLHGYDHYWLNKLSTEELKTDIDKALESMGDLIDPDAWVMNYPYGSYCEEVVNYIAGKGCVLGLSTDVRSVNLKRDNRYILPRLDTNDFPPKSERYKEL